MKNLFAAVTLVLLAAILITPGFAQKPKSKDDAFKEIAALANTKKPEDQEKAYQLSRDFLKRFGKDKDDNVKKIKTFHDNSREYYFFVVIDANKFADAFSIGREILTEQPENVAVLLNLAYAGYNAQISGNGSFVEDALSYDRKAVQLLGSGNLAKSFAPFKDKDEALAFMYFIDGKMSMDKDPKAAIANIYKATLFDSSVKNSAAAYDSIAVYYESIYAKMQSDLQAKVNAKTISDAELKAENDKIAKVVDLMMDAYARALTRTDSKAGPGYNQIKDRLTQVYRFRNKSDDGFAEYVKYVNTIPLPDPSKF